MAFRIEHMMFADSAEPSPRGVDISGGGATNAFLEAIPGELVLSVVFTLVGEPRDLDKEHTLRLDFRSPSDEQMGTQSFRIGPLPRNPAKPPHLAAHINWVVDVSGFLIPEPGWYRLVATIDADIRVSSLGVFEAVSIDDELRAKVEAVEQGGYQVEFHPSGTYDIPSGLPAPAVAVVWRDGEGATPWFGTGSDAADALEDVVEKLRLLA